MTPIKEIDAATAAQWISAEDTVLIDVREANEHQKERIEGAELHPLSAFDPQALPQDKRIIVHCGVGKRGEMAVQALLSHGFEDVHNLMGGLMGWRRAGFATV